MTQEVICFVFPNYPSDMAFHFFPSSESPRNTGFSTITAHKMNSYDYDPDPFYYQGLFVSTSERKMDIQTASIGATLELSLLEDSVEGVQKPIFECLQRLRRITSGRNSRKRFLKGKKKASPCENFLFSSL